MFSLPSHMRFRVSHIYREGNGFENKLASIDTTLLVVSRWDFAPESCLPFYAFSPGHATIRACI